MQTNISIKDFKRIKEISKKTKCRININRKKGLPFMLNKYKKRKIFVKCLCNKKYGRNQNIKKQLNLGGKKNGM